MGLINLDNYVCSNGVQKTSTYISFATETIYLRQNMDGTYSINANYRIFWDEAARNSNLSFIDLKSVQTTVAKDMLDCNLYGCLYEVLKQTYPNTVDALAAVASVPIAPIMPSIPVSIPVIPIMTVPVSIAPVVEPAPAPAPAPEEPVSEPVANGN